MIYRDLPAGRIPALGLGTWQLENEACLSALAAAFDIGYRHIDTAVRYGNEAEVGQALRLSGIDRGELFVTTKVWHDSLQYDALLASCEASLDRLGLEYVDLFLVHWPNPEVPLEETIAALIEVQARGFATHIGVSNFTAAQIKYVCDVLKAPIVSNQVEWHPWLDQTPLLSAMRARGVKVEAYQPLGGGKVLDDKLLTAIGERYGKSAAQVALRWFMQKDNAIAIPRSKNPKNLAANFAIFDFSLTREEMAQIDALQGKTRFINPAFAPAWDTV